MVSSFSRPRARRAVSLALVAFAALVSPMLGPALLRAQSATKSDSAALANYRLTMPTVRKLTLAMENMSAALKTDPDIAKAAEAQRTSSDASLDEMAASISRVPPMKRAIEKAGLTPREYMLAQLVLFQASMISGVMEQQKTNDVPPGFSKANVAFVRANQKEIDQLGARMQELSKEHDGEKPQPETDDAETEDSAE